MDQPLLPAKDDLQSPHAVLARVRLTWAGAPELEAVVLHAAPTMLVLESSADARLPEPGTTIEIDDDAERKTGRLAEQGRGGRFLIALGDRDVRHNARLRVSLPAVLRSPALSEWREVELADLTTGGARVRGVELPVGTPVTLDFLPPPARNRSRYGRS